MDNFKGYYMKCNGCTFQSPSFKREGFRYQPRLIQVADATTTASGYLSMKVLPHVRSKIWCSFPPMTPDEYQVYYKALDMEHAGPSMSLSVEVFNEGTNAYETDTYYHTDIGSTPIMLEGRRMIQIDDFELIGH